MQPVSRLALRYRLVPGCWCKRIASYTVKNGQSFSQMTNMCKPVSRKTVNRNLQLSGLCGCSRQQHTNMVQNSQVKLEMKKKQKPESVLVRAGMTVAQLADEIGVRPGLISDMIQEMGEPLNLGHQTVLSPDLAELVLMDFEISPVLHDNVDNEFSKESTKLVSRPPVVTIMGHVDHGKTTLLDSLRKTSVAAGEAGGITQHIGAFSVQLPSDDTITFIDTPGHAAFNAMRSRGANVTDIVVLVVAADDGIKAQTVESIKHANRAKVPIIVAINKVDKPRVNVDQVKQQLLQHAIQLEEFGGDVQAVEISALKGTNLDSLTEAIITQCDLLDLKANTKGLVQGVVLESKTERGRGPVATVLVQSGILKKGCIVVAGAGWAKVRQLFDDKGQTVSEASPSTPVEVLGWRGLPSAGDAIEQVESERKAQELVSNQQSNMRSAKLSSSEPMPAFPVAPVARKGWPGKPRLSIQDYDASDKLDIVIKGDVHGSVEAILDALKSYKADTEVKLSVLHSGVGPVAESDIKMAEPFRGMVFGFNVKVPKDIVALAKNLGVQVKTHSIIYKLLEDLKDHLSIKLPPLEEEVITGEAVVQQVFNLTGSKRAVVAGCRVKQGNLNRSHSYKLVRDGVVIHEGKLSSMKCKQEPVNVAKKETECGLTFENFSEFQEGDRVQSFITNQLRQEINWNWGF